MTTIASIVEGHGEVSALPVLLRRIAYDTGIQNLDLPRPHRVPKGRMTDPHEIGRALRLQADRIVDDGAVVVTVDGDDDCAVDLARKIREAGGVVRAEVLVVVAIREFESIFLAGGRSLLAAGKLTRPPDFPGGSEHVRGAKERIGVVIDAPCYQETTHQVKLAAAVSLSEARSCQWFTKLERDLRRVFRGP